MATNACLETPGKYQAGIQKSLLIIGQTTYSLLGLWQKAGHHGVPPLRSVGTRVDSGTAMMARRSRQGYRRLVAELNTLPSRAGKLDSN